MADIVNLKGFRKRKAREEAERKAAERRARSGARRSERERLAKEGEKSRRDLDGKRLD